MRLAHPSSPRAGRTAILSWIVVFVLLVSGLILVRFRELATHEPSMPIAAVVEDEEPEPPVTVEGWAGQVRASSEGVLRAELVPYHMDPDYQSYRSERLEARLRLSDGELWRVLLYLDASGGEPVPVDEVQVKDDDGVALVSLAQAADGYGESDPLLNLFAGTKPVLEPGVETCVALWGRRPGESPKLVIGSEGASLSVKLDPRSVDVEAVPRWFLESARPDSPVDEEDREVAIAELQAELERERDRRRSRELEWLEFLQTLGKLDVGPSGAAEFTPDPELVPGAAEPEEQAEAAEEPEEEVVDAEVAEANRRAEEIAVALRTLFKMESLRGMDLLEVGTLGDGWVGPVVFRLLDERGFLAGSVVAQHLRLEASRAGRTLTIVLEDGSESAGGERVPFKDGVRVIMLPYVDPEPWMESVPELFSQEALHPPNDDGLWPLVPLRKELNRLLGLDATNGWFRVRNLGGVLGDELVDVSLVEFDSSGRIRRRIFADRMRIQLEDKGVQLQLEDGAIVTGGDKKAFRGGTHRIFLPRARRKDWEAVPLPGLAEPPASHDEEQSGDSSGDEG